MMMHVEAQEKLHAVPPVAERLALFEAATTPVEQWYALDAAINHDPSEAYAFTSAMLDIAANPDSSSAMLVRMRALELAASELKYGNVTVNQVEFEVLREGFRKILPEYFEMDTPRVKPRSEGGVWPDDEGSLTRFGEFALRFADKDGLPRDLVSRQWDEPGEPYTVWRVQDPGIGLVPGMLIEGMVGQEDGPRYALNSLPTSLKREYTDRLLQGLPGLIRGEKDVSDLHEMAEYARLGRFNQIVMGESVHDSIARLYEVGGKEGLEYARILNKLYDSAAGLDEVFPAELGGRVSAAARALIGKALHAVVDHMHHGNSTHGAIALKKGRKLPVHFEKDEPLELLRGLDQAFSDLHGAVTAPDARSVLSMDGQGFRMYRFLRGSEVTNVTHYIRPAGERAFDIDYEHGRHYEGVEASIGYNIDLNDKELPGLKKRDRGNGVISIRLDREARPHPGARDGKISLDIGSVLGNENNFGTKIGRLIAWGDTVYRKLNPQYIKLNHMDYILGSTYGAADKFMQLGLIQDERMQRRALRGEQAVTRQIGRSGLRLVA